MKVYVVMQRDYEDATAISVYEDRAEAEADCAESRVKSRFGYDVEEVEYYPRPRSSRIGPVPATVLSEDR